MAMSEKSSASTALMGFVRGLSNDEYHRGNGLSKGDLDLLAISPAHYHAAKINPPVQTEAMKIGTAFHSFVLEPELFIQNYAERPKFNMRTKDGKQAAEEWEVGNENKIGLESDTMMMLANMRDSLMANPIIKRLVEKTEHELSVYAERESTLCKCRPDGWDGKNNIVLDLKSAVDASADGFRRAVSRGRYHVQAAWYSLILEAITGERVNGFYFVACEKTPPYACAIYELDISTVALGKALAMRDFARYREAMEKKNWKAYPQSIQPLRLSGWELSQYIGD